MEKIVQLINYKKLGKEFGVETEIVAETKEEAIEIIKKEIRVELMKELEDKVERGYSFTLINSYKKAPDFS